MDGRKRCENATSGHEFSENGEKSCVFSVDRASVPGLRKDLQSRHVMRSCRWWTNKFMNGKMILFVDSTSSIHKMNDPIVKLDLDSIGL